MKVLVCFTDPRFGGPGKRSINVAKKLRIYGIDTEFLIPIGDNSLSIMAREANIPVHRLDIPRIRSPRRVNDNLRFILGYRSASKAVVDLIGVRNFDIAHVNTPYNFPTAHGVRKSSTPLIWHFNDVLTPRPISNIATYAGSRWADEIVASSRDVVTYFGLENLPYTILYPPVNLGEYNPKKVAGIRDELERDYEFESDDFLIGMLSNINPIKGHKYLIEALFKLDSRVRNSVKTLIFGKKLDSQAKYYAQLQRIISSYDLNKTIEFTGWRDDVGELLASIDLLLMPSVAESGPMAVLEAMAMNCPVVTTNVGIVKEEFVDQEHAWVVPPKDSEALFNAINEAIRSPAKRKRFSTKARLVIEDTFSLESCAEKHRMLYQNIGG